ncbi:hypothetical protein PG988_013456 [Apiospora saccharicola]
MIAILVTAIACLVGVVVFALLVGIMQQGRGLSRFFAGDRPVLEPVLLLMSTACGMVEGVVLAIDDPTMEGRFNQKDEDEPEEHKQDDLEFTVWAV